MKVLVTGAAGFLGRRVVVALLDRGHEVRAVLRPTTDVSSLPWAARVEVFRADLRAPPDLRTAFDGIDVLVHLAAAMSGSESAMFAGTVGATERLLAAMAGTLTRRIVLASSFSVYDWGAISGVLDEDSPVAESPYDRDAYSVSKVWQERITRRMSAEHGWELTVLRPGYIWGRGGEWLYGVGLAAGPVLAAVAPRSHLPLTHVRNCADCFAAAVGDDRSIGRTYNVVDGHGLSTWEYAGYYARWAGASLRIPVPYRVGLVVARALFSTVGALARRPPRLPSLFVPTSYEARFKPLRVSSDRLSQELDWRPPYDLAACLDATFGRAG